jgi:hypothetical protein
LASGDIAVSSVPVVVEGSMSVWVRRVTTLAVVAVAVVAGVGSYAHMRHLAVEVGEGWRSWLLPISVDGLAVAASMTMLVRRREGQPGGRLPWTALVVSLGASLAANVAAAEPTVAGRVVAGWPPLALLLAYELLLGQLDNSKHRGGSTACETARPGAQGPFETGDR